MTTPTPCAETIAHDLMGTCDSLQAALERREWDGADNDSSFCDGLDSLAFECLRCGWWFPICEMSEREDADWCCADCGDDDE